jgi:hypothetical protein
MNTRAQALPYEHLRRTEHWHIYTFPGGGGGSAGGVEVSDYLGERGGGRWAWPCWQPISRGNPAFFFHAPAPHEVLCSFVSLLKWYPSPTRLPDPFPANLPVNLLASIFFRLCPDQKLIIHILSDPAHLF